MFRATAALAETPGFVVNYVYDRRRQPEARPRRPGEFGPLLNSFEESSMIAFRWAAACTLAVALMAGCQTKKAPEPVANEMSASTEKAAAAKARYMAKGDMLVGEVDAAKDGYAAVSGIDAKSVGKDDVFSFIDVDRNNVINHCTFSEVGLSGRIIVKYESSGEERAPRPGDLCVKTK